MMEKNTKNITLEEQFDQQWKRYAESNNSDEELEHGSELSDLLHTATALGQMKERVSPDPQLFQAILRALPEEVSSQESESVSEPNESLFERIMSPFRSFSLLVPSVSVLGVAVVLLTVFVVRHQGRTLSQESVELSDDTQYSTLVLGEQAVLTPAEALSLESMEADLISFKQTDVVFNDLDISEDVMWEIDATLSSILDDLDSLQIYEGVSIETSSDNTSARQKNIQMDDVSEAFNLDVLAREQEMVRTVELDVSHQDILIDQEEMDDNLQALDQITR